MENKWGGVIREGGDDHRSIFPLERKEKRRGGLNLQWLNRFWKLESNNVGRKFSSTVPIELEPAQGTGWGTAKMSGRRAIKRQQKKKGRRMRNERGFS